MSHMDKFGFHNMRGILIPFRKSAEYVTPSNGVRLHPTKVLLPSGTYAFTVKAPVDHLKASLAMQLRQSFAGTSGPGGVVGPAAVGPLRDMTIDEVSKIAAAACDRVVGPVRALQFSSEKRTTLATSLVRSRFATNPNGKLGSIHEVQFDSLVSLNTAGSADSWNDVEAALLKAILDKSGYIVKDKRMGDEFVLFEDGKEPHEPLSWAECAQVVVLELAREVEFGDIGPKVETPVELIAAIATACDNYIASINKFKLKVISVLDAMRMAPAVPLFQFPKEPRDPASKVLLDTSAFNPLLGIANLYLPGATATAREMSVPYPDVQAAIPTIVKALSSSTAVKEMSLQEYADHFHISEITLYDSGTSQRYGVIVRPNYVKGNLHSSFVETARETGAPGSRRTHFVSTEVKDLNGARRHAAYEQLLGASVAALESSVEAFFASVTLETRVESSARKQVAFFCGESTAVVAVLAMSHASAIELEVVEVGPSKAFAKDFEVSGGSAALSEALDDGGADCTARLRFTAKIAGNVAPAAYRATPGQLPGTQNTFSPHAVLTLATSVNGRKQFGDSYKFEARGQLSPLNDGFFKRHQTREIKVEVPVASWPDPVEGKQGAAELKKVQARFGKFTDEFREHSESTHVITLADSWKSGLSTLARTSLAVLGPALGLPGTQLLMYRYESGTMSIGQPSDWANLLPADMRQTALSIAKRQLESSVISLIQERWRDIHTLAFETARIAEGSTRLAAISSQTLEVHAQAIIATPTAVLMLRSRLESTVNRASQHTRDTFWIPVKLAAALDLSTKAEAVPAAGERAGTVQVDAAALLAAIYESMKPETALLKNSLLALIG